MKHLVSVIAFLTVLTMSVFVGIACTGTSKDKTQADSLEVVANDTVEAMTIVTPEVAAQMAACKEFLDNFYQNMWDSEDDSEVIRENVTPRLLKYLRDSYDYDCLDGDCMATWLFFYDTTADVGELKGWTIDTIDQYTYKVVCTYERGDATGGDYEYGVLLGVVKTGDTFLVDDLEEVTNRFEDEEENDEE